MRGTFEEEAKAARERKRQLEESKPPQSLTSGIEARDLKQKKKLIDKFIKLRQDTQEMAAGKKTTKQGEMNKTLFVEGLSRVTQPAVLNELFSRYPGFIEVRPFPEKQVAFVEYDHEEDAAMALQMLDGYVIRENNGEQTVLRVSYAKH